MKKSTFTLHLVKPDVSEFDDILTQNAKQKLHHESTQVILAPDFADGAKLYIFKSGGQPPDWLRELGRHFQAKMFVTTSLSSILCFRHSGRMFAVTFAHAWMYLEEKNFEGDFGLRVALNALDETKLRKLERANLGDALRGVALSPFQRDFRSFGTDDALDLVRKISGRTRDKSGPESVTGARSLKLTGEFDFPDLPRLADYSLKLYGSDFYKSTSFSIIDFVTPITDQRLISNLDSEAARSIRDNDGSFELSLPISYDDECAEYKFIGPGLRGRYPDLQLQNYITLLGEELPNITEKVLNEHKVVAIFANAGKPNSSSSIRSGLVGSVLHNGRRYAINEGEWYQVDEAFKLDIEKSFRDLIKKWSKSPEPFHTIYDPSGKNGHYEAEGDYNKRIAPSLGLLCLDTKLIHVPGIERSSFEACDLLDITNKRFIHVKKSSRRSSTLSHLFKQGSNSAQNFKRFPGAWEELMKIVSKEHGQHHAETLKQAIETRNDWTVEYWIADTPRDTGDFNIPFFSRISIRDEARNLRAMEFKVALRFIELPSPKLR